MLTMETERQPFEPPSGEGLQCVAIAIRSDGNTLGFSPKT